MGDSSSDLTVAEMSDLIEIMYAWGADAAHPVTWSEPDVYHATLSSSARDAEPAQPAGAVA